MKRYLSNRLFKVGFWLAVVGWSPLLAVVVLDELHLWPDPNPNPIGLGLLFFVTFWPAVICLTVGGFQVLRTGSVPVREGSLSAHDTSPGLRVTLMEWARLPAARIGAGAFGVWLAVRGYAELSGDGQHHRGGGAAILYGIVLVYWAIAARVPMWLKIWKDP